MSEKNAEHKIVYQETKRPGDRHVEVIAHKWQWGNVTHYVMREVVFDTRDPDADPLHEAEELVFVYQDSDLQRMAINRFDMLIYAYTEDAPQNDDPTPQADEFPF